MTTIKAALSALVLAAGVAASAPAQAQSSCEIYQEGNGNSASCEIYENSIDEDELADRIAERLRRNDSRARPVRFVCQGPFGWRDIQPWEIVSQYCMMPGGWGTTLVVSR